MPLNVLEIQSRLSGLNNWEIDGKHIKRVYEFGTHIESLSFVNKAARVGEELNHHPDILLQFNKVTLFLTTHSENGVTEKDFNFAKRIDVV